MSLQADLDRASALLNRGEAHQSAEICGAILAREPRNAVAAHLLGLALKEIGDLEQGAEWMRLSIRLDPNQGEFRANFGNLLRKWGKPIRAERAYRAAVELLPDHRPARTGLALTLIDLGRTAEAEEQAQILIKKSESEPDGWVTLGLALDAGGRTADAEAAYRRAIALDPAHAVARHNLGALLARLERPEASKVLDEARRLGADGYEAAFNRGHALLNEGDVAGAENEFARAVEHQPDSIDAQLILARLRFMRGDAKFARALAAASSADRDNIPLQRLLAEVMWRAGNLTAAETFLQDLLKRKGPEPQVQSLLAQVLLEQGLVREAEEQALAAVAGLPEDERAVQTLVSVLLARERAAEAAPFIAGQRQRHPQSQTWVAFEASAARSLGRDRYRELYDYERLLRVFELETPRGWSSVAELNEALKAVLAERHRFSNHPFDQTLRNGTQTPRSLLTDPDPAIRSLLQAFEGPIREYRRALGTAAGHPLSAANSGEARFTGAWSVRLHRDGFHVNHVHPDGLISSAYYVDVPVETLDAETKSGWIKFGEPRYPIPGHAPERFVQPRPGRLVLFPSYMWHGTNAIRGADTRLCVAFDVRAGGGGAR